MPSKRLSNKSFERDASRLRVLMNNDFGGGGGLGYEFAPFLGGFDGSGTPQHWGRDGTTKAGFEAGGGDAMAAICAPTGATSCAAYPVIANNGTAVTWDYGFFCSTFKIGDGGSTEYEEFWDSFTFAANDLNWISEAELTISVESGDVIIFHCQVDDGSSIYPWGVLCEWS